MRITVMGHAGLYVEAADARVLLDPVLHTDALGTGAYAHTYARELDLAAMPRPTLLAITHAHIDHLDPRSLALISRDTPVLAPQDPHTLEEVARLGFTRVHALDAWETLEHAGARITATPTDSGVDEVGFLFESRDGRFWHMSDAEATVEAARHIVAAHGPCDVVGTKYQPTTRVMAGLFRSFGASFDKREMVEWLEAAVATQPKLVFPYASGLTFVGRHAWLNRYMFPYAPGEIVEWLCKRMDAFGGRASDVRPGDVIVVNGGDVRLESQASAFIKHVPSLSTGSQRNWEPIDTTHFRAVEGDADRAELARKLHAILAGPWSAWLKASLSDEESPVRGLMDMAVAWQLAVHMGDERLYWSLDFAKRPLQLIPEPAVHPNFCVHICGRTLLEVLRGEAGTELLYSCGGALLYEKIFGVREGRFWSPADGFAVYSRLPDPLTYYLRWQGPEDGLVKRGTF